MAPTSCPASAIKHRIPHLVYTSAYEGNDCTGAYWASANRGDGVAMRIVERTAGTAVDPTTDGDGDDSLPPIADYDNGGAGGPQGTYDVGPCPHRLREDPGDPAALSSPRTGGGGRLREPRWGFVRRLGVAFGLCAWGKPPTQGSPTRTLGTRGTSYGLPRLLRGWLTLTIWFLLRVQNTRPFRLRGSALSGPTLLVFRRGEHRWSHHRRLLSLRLLLPAMPIQPIASLFPMGGGRVVGPATRLPPAFPLGFEVKRELALVTGT